MFFCSTFIRHFYLDLKHDNLAGPFGIKSVIFGLASTHVHIKLIRSIKYIVTDAKTKFIRHKKKNWKWYAYSR